MSDLEKTEKSHLVETRKPDKVKNRKKTSPVFFVLFSVFGGFIMFLLIIIVGIILLGNGFIRYGIVLGDLTEYRQIIKTVEFDTDQKDSILEQIERIREKARNGKHPGFWAWLDYDESIRSLIDDRKITEEEAKELTRELESLDKSTNNK